MNIPIITSYQNRKQIRLDRLRAETDYLNQKTNAYKENTKARDKALEAVIKLSQPQMTLNEELYGGAGNRYSTSIWNNNFNHARRLSRIGYAESPAAQALIGRFVDLVIGPRFTLQSMPAWDLIRGAPATDDARQELVSQIETRWRLWAKQKNVSYTRQDNHHQISRQSFHDLLIDGEYFAILRYSNARRRNGLSIQIIKPEHIQRIDSTVPHGHREENGIEYDKKGEEVAYHIISDPNKSKSVRVPKMGPKSGRVFVIHNKLGPTARGVGLLAGIITELTKLADFQALEIQAAVINALFAVTIETEIGGENKEIIPKTGISSVNAATGTTVAFSDAEYEAKLKKTQFEKGGIIVQNMGEGQKAKSFDTKRPTANFGEFFKAVKRNLYSARGMALSAADYDFPSNYSGARGELLVLWNRILTLRSDHSTDYEDIIYKMWLWGEFDLGNVNLTGWQDESIRDAWSNAEWTGPARPDIDPMRSAKAHELETKNGWKTDKKIAAERGGGDWDENMQVKKSENDKKADALEKLTTLENTTHSRSENVTESTSTTKEG